MHTPAHALALPLLVLLGALAACDADAPPASPLPGAAGEGCPGALVGEPPCNPFLADGPWASSHRASYAQGSSPLEAPRAGEALSSEHIYLSGSPITLVFSGRYPDGGRAIWGSPVGSVGGVVKLDAESLTVIDEYVAREREAAPPAVTLGITGAYTLIDRDGRFLVARSRSVEVFEDSVPGDRASPIALARRFDLPDSAFCGADDLVVGMTLTYDGAVAFVTERGVVGVVPRAPEAMRADRVVTHTIHGAECGGDGVETVSNSIAADEQGGIYVVSSAALYRVDWDGARLTAGWRAEYALGAERGSVRLGAGSGSTPSLMGTDGDRFVVITDAQPLMHLVLMWRDAIPPGWAPIAPGKDPRIACEVPITFGDPQVTRSLSEQSVLVRGHAAVVVNNQLADPSFLEGQNPLLQNILAALEGGDPAQAPRGLQRVDWDPQARRCEVVWANPEPSVPNAIPTMSERTGLIYAQGQTAGAWGLSLIDFETGAEVGFEPAPDATCDGLWDALPAVERLGMRRALERLPASCENSFYAATEVGPGGAIYQGTLHGLTRYRPAR